MMHKQSRNCVMSHGFSRKTALFRAFCRGDNRVINSMKEIVFYISRIDGKYILRHLIKGFKSWQKLMKGSAAWLRREPRNS